MSSCYLTTRLTIFLLVAILGISAIARSQQSEQDPALTQANSGALHTFQGTLVDAADHEVRLTGVNWYGAETQNFAPEGLSHRNWQAMLDQIVRAGFNTIRLPFSNQFLDTATSRPQDINYRLNPDLNGLHGLGLLDHVIAGARARGLKIILDRHRPTASEQTSLWYTDQVPESRWITDWVELARHYRNDATVIGADLHGEPHNPATWGNGDPKTDWRLAAERAGNAILQANPDWLIIVEGIEQYKGSRYWWGGNLAGAEQFPVRLSRPDKLVYSAHDYGPEVSPQAWFHAANFPQNLVSIWKRYWAYLQIRGQSPVLVGEFGARSVGPGAEGIWLRQLLNFLKLHNFSYTYWAWNPDSADTGGLLLGNWKTLDPQKLNLLLANQAPLLDKSQRTARLLPQLLVLHLPTLQERADGFTPGFAPAPP